MLQLPELQFEQEWPVLPGMAWGTPDSLVIKPTKLDIFRLAGLWQRGHSAVLSDWLKGRIFSNLESHSERYFVYRHVRSPIYILADLDFLINGHVTFERKPEEVDGRYLDPDNHVSHHEPFHQPKVIRAVFEKR